MNSAPSLGTLFRRARKQLGLPQIEVARRAEISQPSLSFYERDLKHPPTIIADRLAVVLNIRPSALNEVAQPMEAPSPYAPRKTVPSRNAFLRLLDALPGSFRVIDHPIQEDGGDLAFAVDFRSHIALVLIDAVGSGMNAVAEARLLAAAAYGALMLPEAGAPIPEDVVQSVLRFTNKLNLTPDSLAMTVMTFDPMRRLIRQCRLRMPAPIIRSNRVHNWTGKPVGPSGAHVDEIELHDGDMMIIGTDGIAHLRTRSGAALWDSPEFRTTFAQVRSLDALAENMENRIAEATIPTQQDDLLAIVVSLWNR